VPAILLELLAMELPDVCSISYLVSAIPATKMKKHLEKQL
jgi:hypothetical protein